MTPKQFEDECKNVFLQLSDNLRAVREQLSECLEDLLAHVYAAVIAAAAEQSERRLAYLAHLRSRLAGGLNLRASLHARLIVLIDRIRGILGLMLARVRNALSRRLSALKSTLVRVPVGLRCIHRNEPDDDCWLPLRPKQPYGRIRGVAHAVS